LRALDLIRVELISRVLQQDNEAPETHKTEVVLGRLS
jgi:hypothetical protein